MYVITTELEIATHDVLNYNTHIINTLLNSVIQFGDNIHIHVFDVQRFTCQIIASKTCKPF